MSRRGGGGGGRRRGKKGKRKGSRCIVGNIRKAGIRSDVGEEKRGKVRNRWRDGNAELSISKKRKEEGVEEEEEEDRDREIWVSRPWG